MSVDHKSTSATQTIVIASVLGGLASCIVGLMQKKKPAEVASQMLRGVIGGFAGGAVKASFDQITATSNLKPTIT